MELQGRLLQRLMPRLRGRLVASVYDRVGPLVQRGLELHNDPAPMSRLLSLQRRSSKEQRLRQLIPRGKRMLRELPFLEHRSFLLRRQWRPRNPSERSLRTLGFSCPQFWAVGLDDQEYSVP